MLDLVKDVFLHLDDASHRLSRRSYILTWLFYSIGFGILSLFVLMLFKMIIPKNSYLDFTILFNFIVGFPLVTSKYHRLRDVGLSHRFSFVFVIIGICLALVSISMQFMLGLSFATIFTSLSSIFKIISSLIGLLIVWSIEFIYKLVSLFYILSKTDRFSSKVKLEVDVTE